MARNYKDELDAEDLKTLGSDIIDGWTDDNIDRQDWLKDLSKWIKAYLGRPEQKNVPFEGASNLHVPVTGTAVDAIHPRLVSSWWKPDPIVGFKAQEPSDAELAKKREKFLDWALREEINAFPITDRALLGTCLNGVQFVKIYWDLRIRHLRDKHEFPKDIPLPEMIAALTQSDLGFVEAVQRVEGYDKVEAVIKGRKVEFDLEETPSKFCFYTERDEIVKDAPTIELIDAEDIVVPSNAPWDLQDAHHVYHRYWITRDKLARLVARGMFDLSDQEEEDIDALFDTSENASDDNTYDVKTEKETVTGTAKTYREGEPEQLELIDAYIPYDINDDGFDEEIIVTLVRDKPAIILRINRLEEVYRHGMRPFESIHFAPADTSFWSIGIPQILEDLQKEFNALHNLRIDAGTISNTPWAWYEPSAGLNPETIQVTPGEWIPVDNVNGVKEHQPGNFTAWGEREEAILWAMVERRLKVNDLTLGRIGETQGASRTATGVQALAAQQATGFDLLIRRTQEGFKRILRQVLALYQQYMPPGKEVRILGKYTGEPETIVSRKDLRGQMDMVFSGNALSTDREVERSTYAALSQGPLAPGAIGFYLQLGIMTPPNVSEWLRHLLTVFDVPNVDRIVSMPKMPILNTPDEVISKLLRGERVLPQGGEDHQAIMGAVQSFLSSDKAVGLEPEHLLVFQEQLKSRQMALIQLALAQQTAQMMMQAQMAMSQMQGLQLPPGQGGAPPPFPQGRHGLAY